MNKECDPDSYTIIVVWFLLTYALYIPEELRVGLCVYNGFIVITYAKKAQSLFPPIYFPIITLQNVLLYHMCAP